MPDLSERLTPLNRPFREPSFPAWPKLAFVVALLLSVVLPSAPAQDESPAPKLGNLRITFLPPPMEGTLSLGIYTKSGKLVRVLQAEAIVDKDFAVGLNGLSTHWDGRDDAGNPAPAGKYYARGFCVGKLDVEGVAFHGNDWMTDDDSPRVRQLTGIALTLDDDVLVNAERVDGAPITLRVRPDGKTTVEAAPGEAAPAPVASGPADEGKRYIVRGGKIIAAPATGTAEGTDLQAPLDSAIGPRGSLWVIDQTTEGAEIKQFAANGEFLRRLAVPAGEPPPQRIVASKTKDLIALLETAPRVQRLRVLALETPASTDPGGVPLSTWKTLFSKTIYKSDDYASVADKLDRDKPFPVEDKARVRLLPNPLFKDAMHDIDVRVAVDAKGSNLVTFDGLPLCRITDTPRLKWAVMGHEGATKAITVFQSDGAVVEEFRAHRLANMMAFDAGEYEWTAK